MKETLELDDVVFMYATSDPEVYTRYGATAVAWGGAHTREVVQKMSDMGIHATGTLWCLTATAKVLHEDADLREATARDIEGNPIIVPWQRDKVHEGTPTWWGCTNHPTFRAHVRKKVCEAMAGGAKGLHVDDHLGVAHPTLYNGGCFCDFCMTAFRNYLVKHDSNELRKMAGVPGFADFDYRAYVQRYATTRETYLEVREDIPLHQLFVDCQLQRAAEHTRQLGELAAQIVERPVTLSANTGLPSLSHTVVARNLTYLVGEVNHRANEGTDELSSVVKAYRMAETLGRPIAATAAGTDWAHVKATQCSGLVCVWIALSYACGQRLMVPHRMWCHTPELGTHWYDGPIDVYSPLYRFVRNNARLLSDCRTVGPLLPPENVPPFLDTHAQRMALQAALEDGNSEPITVGKKIWLFPRKRSDGALILHLVNLDYDSTKDAIRTHRDITVTFSYAELDSRNGSPFSKATMYAYDADPSGSDLTSSMETSGDICTIRVPEQRLWSVIELT